MPKAMRYQAKGTKSWLEMKRSSQRTHRKAEMKAEMKPTTHMPRSSALSSARLLVELVDGRHAQGRNGQEEGELGGRLARQAEQQATDDGRAGAGGSGNQGESLGDAELEGIGTAHFVDRLDANLVLAPLRPQDDERPEDEGRRHGNRVEQVGLDRLAEGQAENGQRQEGDEQVEDEFWAAGSLVAPRATLSSRSRYSQTTARMAPDWMTISNSLPRSSLKSSRSPARIRWPVDEMGRNSVSPSTMPRMRALSRSIGSMECGQVGEAAFYYPGRVSASRSAQPVQCMFAGIAAHLQRRLQTGAA